MGVALDSLVLTMEYAGIVAVILLIVCLYSRHTNNSGSLNVFQRMPVLLPAIAFIITVMIITSYGLTPMGQYQGINEEHGRRYSGYETEFVILNQSWYTNNLDVYVGDQIDDNESIYVDVAVYQNDSLVDTLHLYFQYSSTDYEASDEVIIALAPGEYQLQMNFTYNYHGIEDEGLQSIQLTISQPLIEGFIDEIVDWGTYQFLINITCILMILGGLGIGSSMKKPKKEEDTDWKTTTEYTY
ncbi:MAG: hypothetical protein RTV31_10250 [Candidatus Thorarchaeota archaeon]